MQDERLQALLDEELLELAALAVDVRRLGQQPKDELSRSILSPERRVRARQRALQAFQARREALRHEVELLRRLHEVLSKSKRFEAQIEGPAKPTSLSEATSQAEGAEKPKEPLRVGRRELFKLLGLATLFSLLRGVLGHAQPTAATGAAALEEEALQAVTVKKVLMDPGWDAPVMLLEAAQSKTLPIWIGTPEASAIALSLEGKSLPRPLTHDLFVKALEAVGARLDHVRITHREDTTYHAALVLRDRDGRVKLVDARPSDAVALALRAGCPIYASEDVIEHGAIELDLPNPPMDVKP
jgi:hypothetical protein